MITKEPGFYSISLSAYEKKTCRRSLGKNESFGGHEHVGRNCKMNVATQGVSVKE